MLRFRLKPNLTEVLTMSYQVLARKYRPQTFNEVVGQGSVTRTLTNSIKSGRIANAYIFCGPRGVGKTSVARLLSKTLNCENAPGQDPCNECSSCREISLGNNIDVLEIDGASNRGIDEIRALRENVRFSPSKGSYKIYIIDEVHMLTQEAFNALLKTLEEPPAHVKFIFATTEAHKVLPTIMSRCQRFDFKRIPPSSIYDRINNIAEKENIDIEDKAALLIARSGEGSLRDSLVILDQMVSFSGGRIAAEDVMELLGMVSRSRIFELSGAVIDENPKKTILVLDDIINSGKSPVFITNSLISHFRDLMILKTAGSPTADMAFSDDEMDVLNSQLAKISLESLLYILQTLTHCLTIMKNALFARAPLEIALIRLTERDSLLSLPELLKKVEKMEGTAVPGAAGTDVSPEAEVISEKKSVPAPDRPRETVAETLSRASLDDDPDEDDVPVPSGDFNAVKRHWHSILNYVKNRKMSVYTFLAAAKPVELSPEKVVIGFDEDHAFNKEVLESEGNRSILQEAVEKITGAPARIEINILDFLGSDKEHTRDDKRPDETSEQMKPVIEKAMDVFGGHIVRDVKEGAE
ncbi:MAG: DNA polymerase III subunit gamma/tau [Candidatus Omnitrophica bacterium]|nr:DNA polymerase III subunit gamma/tau [Candidatus Omnitrophota bacterium]